MKGTPTTRAHERSSKEAFLLVAEEHPTKGGARQESKQECLQ
jgi:hypothetical protein